MQKDAEGIRRRSFVGAADDDFDAERVRARADDVDRLRENIVPDVEAVALVSADPPHEHHCFGGRGCFVQHRRVGDRHPGQIADHRLEIDQRFEPALRNLRLVWRIGRVPRGILEDIALNHRGRVRAVVALTDE